MLMFTNAIMYNNSDQDIFAMTTEMFRDVLEDIEQFVSTQLMVQVREVAVDASSCKFNCLLVRPDRHPCISARIS